MTTHDNDLEQTMPEEEVAEAPQLLAGKYHSVEALEQGYRELSRHLRQKGTAPAEVPDTYDFTLPEGEGQLADVHIDPSDPLLTHLEPVMRAAGISQAQASQLVQAYVGYHVQNAAMNHEREALGAEGEQMTRRLGHFAQKHLNASEQEAMHQLAVTADGVKLLDKLVRMTGEKPIPTRAAHGPAATGSLKEKAFNMMKEPDFKTNRDKQAAYDRLWQDIVALEKRQGA